MDRTQEVGKRKTAIARVYLSPRAGEKGAILINRKPFEQYFPLKALQKNILEPFMLTKTFGEYDVYVNVHGGGVSGQSNAICHGIAKVLQKIKAEHRPILKKAGLLTRDSREVERKKYGLRGARRRFQYSKR